MGEQQASETAARDESLARYLDKMDRAGGAIYTADFRDGFRHALAMVAAYESDDERAPVREAARNALGRRPALEQHSGYTDAELDAEQWLRTRAASIRAGEA